MNKNPYGYITEQMQTIRAKGAAFDYDLTGRMVVINDGKVVGLTIDPEWKKEDME